MRNEALRSRLSYDRPIPLESLVTTLGDSEHLSNCSRFTKPQLTAAFNKTFF